MWSRINLITCNVSFRVQSQQNPKITLHYYNQHCLIRKLTTWDYNTNYDLKLNMLDILLQHKNFTIKNKKPGYHEITWALSRMVRWLKNMQYIPCGIICSKSNQGRILISGRFQCKHYCPWLWNYISLYTYLTNNLHNWLQFTRFSWYKNASTTVNNAYPDIPKRYWSKRC